MPGKPRVGNLEHLPLRPSGTVLALVARIDVVVREVISRNDRIVVLHCGPDFGLTVIVRARIVLTGTGGSLLTCGWLNEE